jgi:putative transcriptional regulator
MKHSAALPLAWGILRILMILNWLGGAAILALLTATIVAREWTFTALGIEPSSYIRPIIVGLRAIAALGLVGVPLNHGGAQTPQSHGRDRARGRPVCCRQRRPPARDRLGASRSPGAQHRHRGIGKAISTPAHPLTSMRAFRQRLAGRVLTFVLARVFAEGTRMREDLEGRSDGDLVKLDDLLHDRRMTLTELAERIDIDARQPVDPQDRQGARDPLLDARSNLHGTHCQPGDLLEFPTRFR